MKKLLIRIFSIISIIFFIIALMSAYYTVTSLIERSQYGNGLMFADVEIFLILTIVFVIAGYLSHLASKKMKKDIVSGNKSS